ncbi:MAG: hypothetical protein LBU32_20875 [Clostridiales bacterium]|nr:hypothetical protein [Clostridiales bacterium]
MRENGVRLIAVNNVLDTINGEDYTTSRKESEEDVADEIVEAFAIDERKNNDTDVGLTPKDLGEYGDDVYSDEDEAGLEDDTELSNRE